MSHSDIDEPPSKRAKISTETDDGILSQPLTNGKSSQINNQESSATQQYSINLKELEVGIATYVTDAAVGIKATLKQRYTDFLVNEILPSGQVVHLSELGVPESLKTHKPHPAKSDPVIAEVTKDAIPTKASDNSATSKTETSSNDIPAVTDSQVEKKPPAGENRPQKPDATSLLSEEDKQKLTSYLNEKAVSGLLNLYQSILDNPRLKHSEYPAVRTEFTADRGLRSEIHQFIREKFSSKIESSTEKDGTLVLTAAKPGIRSNRPQKNNAKSGAAGKPSWTDRGGEYLHFTLYKENKDTMESISWLVKQMRLNAKQFQFAGTKDRRAVTVQRVSAHRVEIERLAVSGRSLRNASLGDFDYHPEGLELGDLAGNEFTITLRDCQITGTDNLSIEEKVTAVRQYLETAMDRLYDHGYLNYFGLQRFGTFVTRTDTTGLHILKGDFKTACESILHYDQDSVPTQASPEDTSTEVMYSAQQDKYLSEDQRRANALDTYKKTSDLHKCLEILPRKFSAEQSILRHLHRQPQDYFGALMAIHRNLRLMYIHAYQSLVWNHAVTHRWQTHGPRVVEGDLVLVHEHKNKHNPNTNPTASSNQSATANPQPSIDADGDPIILPSATDSSHSAANTYERARPLTAAEASSTQYSVFDIVMPLPGFDVEYPNNSSGEFYKSFMREHGGLDPTDMRRKQRDFSLSGGYRKILSRVSRSGAGSKVEVHTYERDDEQFVQTDMEILLAKKKTASDDAAAAAGKNEGGDNNSNKDELIVTAADGTNDTEMQDAMPVATSSPSQVAAVLKFQLGSSQYATMALRELSRGGIQAYQPDYK